jgi:hypothetical protein
MKRLLPFLVLCLLFFFLLPRPSLKAQWENAQVQRLTFDQSSCRVIGLYLGNNDKLCVFYDKWSWDPLVQPYRDTLMVISKEGQAWSQPQKIGYEPFDLSAFSKYLTYDARSGRTHIFYTSYPYFGRAETLYYWNTEIQPSEPVKVGWLNSTYGQEYSSVATEVDTMGNVHVAWHVDFDSASSGWYKVMYANNSTGEWITQQVSPPIYLGGMGSGPVEFCVQRNGTAHITYLGDVGSDLSYYTRNDSLNSQDWHTEMVPKPSRPLWQYGAVFLTADANDVVHLMTGGCIEEYCIGDGTTRFFYYFRPAEDTIWQGPELILDSLFFLSQIFIDSQSVPYVLEIDQSTYGWCFTDRREGFWQEPYQILDFTYYAEGFPFVLDSQGRGHAVFAGCLSQFMGQSDSLEIFYFGAPLSSVEDDPDQQTGIGFRLFQNSPNPFNQSTVIHYSLDAVHPVHATLRLYNILGQEVRELVNARQSRGNYRAYWDGKDNSGNEVSSGVYFCILRAEERKEERKMVLIK